MVCSIDSLGFLGTVYIKVAIILMKSINECESRRAVTDLFELGGESGKVVSPGLSLMGRLS
jgi:hypothetical protein